MLERNRGMAASTRRAQLHLASSAGAAWSEVVLPWFERVLPQSWDRRLPSVVVVPTRGQANYLKTRLVERKASYLGLQFLTPAALEQLLARQDPLSPARSEHLRLLLSIAANEMVRRPNESEMLAAKAVARSPVSLLRTLDSLDTAGWKFDDLGVPAFAPIIGRFEELLSQCSFLLSGEANRRRFQQAANAEPEFAHLLITGFDGAHWPHWLLLRTAVELAESATVVIEEPPENLRDFDLCWIGSWEEVCGEGQRASKSLAGFGETLFTEAEMRGEAQHGERFHFLIGTNLSEQAEAIARQCIHYLGSDKCARLGVIFPAAGALSRLVSQALARFGISHNDGLGHFAPGIFDSEDWLGWIELQRAPRLNSFLRFLNALPNPEIVSSKIQRKGFEDILRDAYSEVLLDDLDILREFCARGDERSQAVSESLREIPFLPPRATFADFLKRTDSALKFFGWHQRAFQVNGSTQNWARQVDVEFPRALFLRWLEETAQTFHPMRSPEGDHPYARVQLLTVPQAQNQEWSHLIFAGWNEGAWPPTPGPDFARPEQIQAFNRNVQQMNKRASREGSQGEGHLSVRENHSLYLGPVEQRAIALRQFDALLELTSEAVTVAASLLQEDSPERLWNPSECFTKLYLSARHEPLTQLRLKDLQRATSLLPRPKASGANIQQTLTAFNARRDSSVPAGEYDFALRTDGSYRFIPSLSVSDLEQMVSAPAIIWIKRYLNIRAPEDMANPWAASTGKWVHQWLASIGEKTNGKLFQKFPSAALMDQRVIGSADERRNAVHELCQSLGRVVPDWWKSGWLNALYLARHLGSKITAATGWTWMAAELPIGRAGAVKIADDIEIQLRGQIDLVLAQANSADFAGQNIWIIDYKTNATKELKRTDLHDNLVKGGVLQLGLYSLAIRALGAAEVWASILSFAVKNVAPQLPVTDLATQTEVFSDLAYMQRTGVFGMKGEIRPSFGYGAPYPLATLPIDPDILEDKWAMTHPALVLEKEEWEIW